MAITGQEAQFINSEIQQESGGSYTVVSKAGALGKYQIMPANLPSWEQEAGLKQEDAQQFLADHAEQDALGVYKLDKYYQQYGPSGAASAWYSGKPVPSNADIQKYVNEVIGRMPSMPTTLSVDTTATGGSPGTTPGGTTATPALDVTKTLLGISTHDFLVRAGLIIFGAIILLVGIFRFTKTGKATVSVITDQVGGRVKAGQAKAEEERAGKAKAAQAAQKQQEKAAQTEQRQQERAAQTAQRRQERGQQTVMNRRVRHATRQMDKARKAAEKESEDAE